MAEPVALNEGISRRAWLRLALGAGALAAGGTTMPAGASLIKRPIPSTGERVPVIGLGTYRTFDVGSAESERAPIRDVLRAFVRLGGGVIDSSPMYGRAETVVGDLATELGVHQELFLATKVWTRGREAGIRQMEQSFRRMRTGRMDLMQVHNLVDWRTHLETLRAWKAQGRIRYLGVTHYTESAYDELAGALESEGIDFVQLNYSIAEPEAERRLLPLALERGVAVIANRPFAGAGLFRRARGESLPSWAVEIGCATWAQFFLKFIVSHPAVTCAIPATSSVKHLEDNMRAGRGVLPDDATRRRMAQYVTEL